MDVFVGRAGSGIGRSKNGRRHFKFILLLFFFHFSNRTENTEVFCYWSVLVGLAGRSKNRRSHFKYSVQRLANELCKKFEPNRIEIGRISPLIPSRTKKENFYTNFIPFAGTAICICYTYQDPVW